jgi:heme exporter protein A
VLEVRNVTCFRGDRPLFSRASLALEAGQAIFLSGPNGAGKTSLLRLICGFGLPEEGEITWRGVRIQHLREEYTQHLLFLGHAAALKDELTAVENLVTAAALAGRPVGAAQAGAALREWGLKGREDLPARVLSQGQRRRVNLARLLLPDPPALWVLDEPFTALDVRAVAQLRDVLEGHLRRGGMLLYTTHQEVAFSVPTVRHVRVEGGAVRAC